MYYKTGSLWLTMLLHFVNNGTVVVLEQIPSLQEVDWIMDTMPLTTYVVAVVVAVVVMLACLMAFRRIPLEQKRGNIDAI
ncbi:MAG: CPBP family intramembrane metalloprotease [Bacteroidaceae bacterium]|nr:CPBP family intramembrane metalloprotease [Bacteroidaceae bacterium]